MYRRDLDGNINDQIRGGSSTRKMCLFNRAELSCIMGAKKPILNMFIHRPAEAPIGDSTYYVSHGGNTNTDCVFHDIS